MPAATRRIMPARVRRTWETASASAGTSRTVWRKYLDQRIVREGNITASTRPARDSISPLPPVHRLGFLTRSELLREADVRPHLLEHPVLERSAAGDRFRLVERRLGLLGAPGREVSHPEVVKRGRLGGPLARLAEA